MQRSHIFKERLDGYTVKDLLFMLKQDVKKLDERMELVEEILENTSFFEEYFDNYYNPHIKTDECLSMDNNVCKLLESFGTYILNSEEILKENKSNQVEYKYITDNGYFDKKIRRESHMRDRFNQYDTGVEVIPFVKKDNNYLKVTEQKIYKKDIEDQGEMGEILRQYNKLIALAQEELKNAKKLTSRNYYLTRFICEGRLDSKLVKDSFMGTIYFKNPCKSAIRYSKIEELDFTNEDVLDVLMTISEEIREVDDMAVVVLCFNEIVDKTNLSKRERIILDYYRNGFNKKEIGDVMNVSRPAIFKTLKKIKYKLKAKAEELKLRK